MRDTENTPLGEPLEEFFQREVIPQVPDAWIDTGKIDHRANGAGIVGYEINFNRYFYKYTPPRPLAEIEADIRLIEKEIVGLLAQETGSRVAEDGG